MPFSLRITGLLASLALLTTLFAAAVPAAAGARSAPQRAQVGTISKGQVARAHARHQRKLGRRAHGKRALADNVGLAAFVPRPKATKARPTATAASSTAGLLFDGAQVSDFPQLQAAPGAITDAPDPAGSGETSIEMTVDNGDVAPITPTENPRAQALSPPIIDNGEEFWLSTKFFIPPDFPVVKQGWMSLVSIYGPPFNGSSPWQIEIVNGRLQWMRNGTYHWDVPWQIPLIKGSWVTVLLHERFASDGFVEMWINGQPVSFFGRETRLNMQTMDASNNGGANAAKIMQYREADMFETGSVFFGPLKIGLSRESVGG